MRQVVLDTETTGLEPSQGHRIIEIGCVELVNRRLTGRHYHQYINPEREVDEGAIEEGAEGAVESPSRATRPSDPENRGQAKEKGATVNRCAQREQAVQIDSPIPIRIHGEAIDPEGRETTEKERRKG